MGGISVGQGSAVGGSVGGGTQIINGTNYGMYTPAWYDAMRAAQVRTAGTAGTAAGTQAANALKEISPSLNGLYGAAGISGPGGAGTGSGSASGSFSAGGPVGTGSGIPSIGPINNDAANAAAFSKAKDTVGNVGRASLDALRGELGSTGALGGGAEVQGVRDITENAAGGLRGVANEQALASSGQALDIAKTNQSSAVTQRGQDIAAQEANARLAMQQNQIYWQRQMQALQTAFSGLSSANGAQLY